MAVYVDGNEVGTIVAATPEGYFDTSDADISVQLYCIYL